MQQSVFGLETRRPVNSTSGGVSYDFAPTQLQNKNNNSTLYLFGDYDDKNSDNTYEVQYKEGKGISKVINYDDDEICKILENEYDEATDELIKRTISYYEQGEISHVTELDFKTRTVTHRTKDTNSDGIIDKNDKPTQTLFGFIKGLFE